MKQIEDQFHEANFPKNSRFLVVVHIFDNIIMKKKWALEQCVRFTTISQVSRFHQYVAVLPVKENYAHK